MGPSKLRSRRRNPSGISPREKVSVASFKRDWYSSSPRKALTPPFRLWPPKWSTPKLKLPAFVGDLRLDVNLAQGHLGLARHKALIVPPVDGIGVDAPLLGIVLEQRADRVVRGHLRQVDHRPGVTKLLVDRGAVARARGCCSGACCQPLQEGTLQVPAQDLLAPSCIARPAYWMHLHRSRCRRARRRTSRSSCTSAWRGAASPAASSTRHAAPLRSEGARGMCWPGSGSDVLARSGPG